MPEAGAGGVIIAQGGAFGGWWLYAKEGRPAYCYNLFGLQRFTVVGDAAIPAGEHQVRVEFAYDGGGLGKGGSATLYLDGAAVGEGRVEGTVPMVFSADETTDVGLRQRHAGERRLRAEGQRLHRPDRVGADRPRRGGRGRRPPDLGRGAAADRDGPPVTVADVHHRLTGGPPTRGRRILVWCLVGLALLLVLVAALTIWVQRQALDTDNWVNTSSELLADDEVRALVAAELVDALFAQRDLEQAVADRLPPALDGLAAPAAGLVRQAAEPAADTLLERPASSSSGRTPTGSPTASSSTSSRAARARPSRRPRGRSSSTWARSSRSSPRSSA